MKKVFPREFSDLLTTKGMKFLNQASNDDGSRRFGMMDNIIREDYCAAMEAQLDQTMYPALKNFHTAIPKDGFKEIEHNFTERLGKSMFLKSVMLNAKRSANYEKAATLGLIDMMNSASFKAFGEVLLNRKFGEPCGKQVICYEEKGYVSPHTDYLPEFPHLKKGYLDLHLMISNSGVQQHWLIYEEAGYLNKMVNIAERSAIAAYHLPFWHHTTPLLSKKRSNVPARRWLVMASYELPG